MIINHNVAGKKTTKEEIEEATQTNTNSIYKIIGLDSNNKLTSELKGTPSTNSAFGDTHILSQATTLHAFGAGIPFEVGSINGLTWFSNLNLFESPSNCRLRFKGNTSTNFLLLASLHAQMGSTLVTTANIIINKNGLSIPPSNTFITSYVISTTQYRNANLHSITSLSLNDEISVWLTFQGASTTILMQDFNLALIQI